MSKLNIANIPALTGSDVPFEYGLDDEYFVAEAPKIVKFVAFKLGSNNLSVELDYKDVYTSFQESYMEFCTLSSNYQTKSIINSLIGMPLDIVSGSNVSFEEKLPKLSMDLAKLQSLTFSREGGVGGDTNLKYSNIDLKLGVQRYDIREYINNEDIPLVSGTYVEIKEIFHFSPVSAYRFFDTSSMLNYLNNQFRFESFTPETIFFLLPVWEDVLRAQQLTLAAKVRRSHYSYIINGDYITVYPVPQSVQKMFFSYNIAPISSQNTDLAKVITGLANVPFKFLAYSTLNENSRQWIRKFTVELSREILGRVRGKFQTIPIPNSDLTLDYNDLISNSRENQDRLREELKLLLEELTYDKIAEREAAKANTLQEQFKNVPVYIYTG